MDLLLSINILLHFSITYRLQSSKFNQPLRFSLLSITAVDLLENKKRLAQWGQKVKTCSCTVISRFRSTLSVSAFCGQSVVVVIMIDGRKTRNSLVGVEVQSPYVIERHSNIFQYAAPGCFPFVRTGWPDLPVCTSNESF